MKKALFVVPIILFLAGCGSEVEQIKSGTMDFNKTITLGQALDNWKSCEKRDWEQFETDNGIKVVQFSCQHKISKFLNKTISQLAQEEQDQTDHLDISSNVQTFQFTINQDDTFQIDNVQVRTTWADGTFFEDSQEPLEQLKTAYANELNFDPKKLDESGAAQISHLFSLIKTRAN
ncbi:hypothetical protein Q5L94_09545 [Idiomarina sp. Sol25]|uniref:hypothetical protein n=1 Tax=Idiomarina sp. Sol25 TaxID=3064000 RepID=UPI00294A9F14|nr:hypothetical protein [Idiomarina sp. Sol25]MDV6328305.1 hypothetical protein [Idiomarina sp. Sol25]